MKYLDYLNKQISLLIISTIVVGLFIIAASFCLVSFALKNRISKTYIVDDLVVDVEDTIDRDLDLLSDVEGMKTNFNKITVTNNGTDSTFRVLLCQKNNNDEYIRVDFDDFFIRTLNQVSFDFGCYLIYSGNISEHSTQEHFIRLWQNIKYKDVGTVRAKFKIKVEK